MVLVQCAQQQKVIIKTKDPMHVPSSIDSRSETNESIEVELTLKGSQLGLLEESEIEGGWIMMVS